MREKMPRAPRKSRPAPRTGWMTAASPVCGLVLADVFPRHPARVAVVPRLARETDTLRTKRREARRGDPHGLDVVVDEHEAAIVAGRRFAGGAATPEEVEHDVPRAGVHFDHTIHDP